MVTVEELGAAWPVREIPFHGTCIVVPMNRFEKLWEDDLKRQGIVVLYQMLPGGPCALVRLKNKQLGPSRPRIVYESKPKESNPVQDSRALLSDCRFLHWTKEEDERLIKRMGELDGPISRRCGVLAKEFKRPISGLMLRYYKIRPGKDALTVRQITVKLPSALPTDGKLPTEVPTEAPTKVCTGEHGLNITVTITIPLASSEQLLALVKGLKEASK